MGIIEKAEIPTNTNCTQTCPGQTSGTSVRTTLIHGDAVATLEMLPDRLADLVLFDPPYPHIKRPYGMMTEGEWHCTMRAVLQECHRILKPHGSLVVVLQTNNERAGRRRMWPWEFVCWSAGMRPDWGLIQDVYAFVPNPLPKGGVSQGLLRDAIKWCVWLGPADCYRNQDAILLEASKCMQDQDRTDDQQPKYDGAVAVRRKAFEQALRERGGVTPINALYVPVGTPVDRHEHPTVTPFRLAEWWCNYLLPNVGVLLDPFCGSGTTLLAGINSSASHVIGIEKENNYLDVAQRRILEWIDDTGNRSILHERLDQRLIEYLRDWIDDAQDTGVSQSDVMGFWDQFSGLSRSQFPNYLALLPESYQTMWLSLAA